VNKLRNFKNAFLTNSGARNWLWASLGALFVLGGISLLFRAPPSVLPSVWPGLTSTKDGATRATVGLVRLGDASPNPVLAQEAYLLDPTPLFLPTSRNSSHKEGRLREPNDSFSGYEPNRIFEESRLSLDLPPSTDMPANPAGALGEEPPDVPYLGFGRSEVAVPPLSMRGAFVEIVDTGSGRVVYDGPVEGAAPPASGAWQPMEFLAAVDAAGLVGPLVRTPTSLSELGAAGAEEVDAYFRRYLAESFRVGQRLTPGFYRICVGP
jgi:hypothetical protein